MPVTGTPITTTAGKTLLQLIKEIAARPSAKRLGIEPALTGTVSRETLRTIINDVISELYNYFPNQYAADLTFTSATSYDLSLTSPAIDYVIALKVRQSTSGQYVESQRWDWDLKLQRLNLHVGPVLGATAKVIYSSRYPELSDDGDTVQGDLAGNESIIVLGVLGHLGNVDSYNMYIMNRNKDMSLRSGKLTFPRKLA